MDTAKEQLLSHHASKSVLPRSSDVFISYARENADFARKLRSSLEEAGLRVWIDESSIPHGVPFLDSIHRGIEGASVVVPLLSEAFATSRFCRLETEHAIRHAKRFVPVCHSPVVPEALPPALGEINWVNFPSERDFQAGVTDCLEAINYDLPWASTGALYLQRALDWSGRGGELLGADGVHALQSWLKEAAEHQHASSEEVLKYLKESQRVLLQTKTRRYIAGGIALAVFAVVPAYVISTTPSTSWMPTVVDGIGSADVAITRAAGDTERIWTRVDLGEVHHPNPYEAEDDAFEAKHAVYELTLEGLQVDHSNYYRELYRFRKWRVGDFSFGEPKVYSPLAAELGRRFAASESTAARLPDTALSLWSSSLSSRTAGVRIFEGKVDIELRAGVSQLGSASEEDKDSVERKLARAAFHHHETRRGSQQLYPEWFTYAAIFRLPSETWLGFLQLMDSGKRYDSGLLSVTSKDQGKTWVERGWIPRVENGSDFSLHAPSITAVAADSAGNIWLTTRYSLSTELGHPSGARGFLASSRNEGVDWANVELPAPLSSYQSYTGVAINAGDPREIVVSVGDQNGTGDVSGAHIWHTSDLGRNWTPVTTGLHVDPASDVRVLWVGGKGRIIATVGNESPKQTLRPIVYRKVGFLERLRGLYGVSRRGA